MGKGRGHIPIRTCISCGAKRPKKEMIRLVAGEAGAIQRDHSGRAGGRGVYVCNASACAQALLKSKKRLRAFRRQRPPRKNSIGGLDG